ncbi:MAG: hypothetical protein QG564_1815 [Campylobacterota bacterium]|nr:hypothetical protein [Campylobacterota bacterium]
MNNTQETLDLLAKAYSQSGSATSGLTMYDLEAPAKTLYPVNTPLRNEIARVVGGMGIQANWRAVTGINTANLGLGLAEGQRGYEIAQSTQDYLAKFAFLGLNNSVTFEAELAAQGFDNIRARAAKDLLQAVMIQEEFLDYAGNASHALGTTGTPVLAAVGSGGSIPDATQVSVICVALSQKGYQQVAGFNNGVTGQSLNIASATLVPTVTLIDKGDGSSNVVNAGTAQKSAAATVTTAAASSSVTATVANIAGAFGFAWFWGASGSEVLGAVTSVNSLTIKTAAGTGSVAASAFTADKSTDSNVYDGLLTQIVKSGSGSYVKALATGNTGMTSDGAGGIVEIDEALENFYNMYRLSPDKMYVSASVLKHMNKLIIANGGAPLIRFNGDINGSSGFQAGAVVSSYLNKITGNSVKIEVHPNAAPGTVMFYSSGVPYPVSEVGNVLVKNLRRDYYQIEWPLRNRKYEFGVYFDGVLQNYFPPAFGLIYNINA